MGPVVILGLVLPALFVGTAVIGGMSLGWGR